MFYGGYEGRIRRTIEDRRPRLLREYRAGDLHRRVRSGRRSLLPCYGGIHVTTLTTRNIQKYGEGKYLHRCTL